MSREELPITIPLKTITVWVSGRREQRPYIYDGNVLTELPCVRKVPILKPGEVYSETVDGEFYIYKSATSER